MKTFCILQTLLCQFCYAAQVIPSSEFANMQCCSVIYVRSRLFFSILPKVFLFLNLMQGQYGKIS